MSRVLGRSGIEVSEVGFGCWAIGGPYTDSTSGGIPVGWGEVDEAESAAALRRAYEVGITFFDTADVYGGGHSERVVGRALAGHRDEVVIATKFGNTFDAGRRTMTGQDVSAAYVRRACEESLRRLGTDRIDLYQLYLGRLPVARAQEVAGTLEDLAGDGMIRSYGWSTDDPERAASFARGPHCAAVQHELNVLADAPAMLEVCDAWDIARIDRQPLAMACSPASTTPPPGCPPGTSAGRGGHPGWRTSPRGARHQSCSPGSAPSARCSPAAGGRWPKVRWAGCWPAARAPCRSRGSGRWRRLSRTPRRSGWGRSRPRRWQRSPGCSAAEPHPHAAAPRRGGCRSPLGRPERITGARH
jgi:aryl-alcohol dehydrogenase-like predicted oxidoreductase